MKANEEQMNYILGVLKKEDIYCSPVLDFENETIGGYEDYDDRIYIDGDVTFDTMAEIVDYLRSNNNIKQQDYGNLDCRNQRER